MGAVAQQSDGRVGQHVTEPGEQQHYADQGQA